MTARPGYVWDGTEWVLFGTAYHVHAQYADSALLDLRTSHIINVREYGATGDGTTNDYTAVAAAIAAAPAGGTVLFPAGVYRLSAPLSVTTDGITLQGAGQGVTVLGTRGTSAGVLRVDADYVTVSGMTLDNTTAAASVIVVGVSSVSTATVVGFTLRDCAVTGHVGSSGDALRATYAVEDFTVERCLFKNCRKGLTVYAPPVGYLSRGIRIHDNRFRNVGNVNIQIIGGSLWPAYRIIEASVCGNDLRDFDQNADSYGPIPIEVTGVARGIISNNIIYGPATRGISTGSNNDMVIHGNVVYGQSMYAFEVNKGNRIVVSNNTVKDCASFLQQTGSGLSDLVISNNTYNGTGLSTTSTMGAVIKLDDVRGCQIIGNVFRDWQYAAQLLRIGFNNDAAYVDVIGNQFLITDANTNIQAVNVSRGKQIRIAGNSVRITRDLAAGDNELSAIMAAGATSADISIVDNEITFLGAIVGSTNCSGVGNGNVGSIAYPVNMVVARNKVVNGPNGVRLRTNLADLQVLDNDLRTCAANNIPATAQVRSVLRLEGTAAPTTGTWRVGDTVTNSTPAVGQPKSWVCTVAGTPGTWVSTGNL